MFTLVSYDIVNDKRRTKVLKLMKGYGTHVQYSVFECDLDGRLFAKLERELRDLIDPNTDSIRCYLIDAPGVQRIKVVGIGRVTVEPGHVVVGR